MQEMQVWSLLRENLLEKEMATHSSILARETPWTEEPGTVNPWSSQKCQSWLSDWTATVFLVISSTIMLIICMAPRHFVSMWKLACCHCLVTNLHQTLCDPMDCSPPGSSTHGSLQSRILEWVTISFSRGSSWPRDWTQVSCTAGRYFTTGHQGSQKLA